MPFRTLFEKQVFVRLTADQTAFICATKWLLFSRTRRIAVDGPGATLPLKLGNLARRPARLVQWDFRSSPALLKATLDQFATDNQFERLPFAHFRGSNTVIDINFK